MLQRSALSVLVVEKMSNMKKTQRCSKILTSVRGNGDDPQILSESDEVVWRPEARSDGA